jgi:uncharacterized protein
MNASEYAKPLPTIEPLNAPFWEATKAGRLSMQQCQACQHIRYPINVVCPVCLSDEVEWVDLSGNGEVLSTIVFHQVYNQAFADDVPYNVSLIQLDEGPRLLSNVVEIAPNAVKVGDRVSVIFDPVTPEVSIPRFVPAERANA